jgi:hypothetical protein
MNHPDRSVVYRVSRNGHVMGEFDIDRIVELLDSGEFLWTDLCWAQGMAGWGPLTGLRAEVAAAKAFPPVAAVPAPVASGRRRVPPAPALVSPSQAMASKPSGWAWVAGGVTLGALVGLLTTHLFPQVVLVDRPVEKIVEVPAALTAVQLEAIEFAKKKEDAFRREVGWEATSMVPVFDKKIRVIVSSQADQGAVSIESIRARVESVFRRNGYVVITETDSAQFASTVVIARLLCVDPKNENQLSGYVSLEVKQCMFVAGGGIMKQAWVAVTDYGMTIQYGRLSFHQVPGLFDDLAVRASNDLLKAGELPYSK